MEYNGQNFKSYDNMYYVSQYGDVFSLYKNGLLKHYIDLDGYHRVDIHGKHIKVHKLVYLVWHGSIPKNMQVNHLDDNKNNNYYKNLYLGTQKENISDCINNEHRIGNTQSVTVYDKKEDKIITFPSVKEFISYTGRNISNGSIAHCKNKKWFQERFDVIEQKGVSTIENYKSIRAVYENSRIKNKAIS